MVWLAIVALVAFAAIAKGRPKSYEVSLSIAISSLVDNSWQVITHETFRAYVDPNDDVHAVSIDEQGRTLSESITRGDETWVRFPGFGWIETDEHFNVGSLAPDHPKVVSAVSGWRSTGRRGELDLYTEVDVSSLLAVLPLGPVPEFSLAEVSSAIGEVWIGQENLTIAGRVLGSPRMIGIQTEFESKVVLEVDFAYNLSATSTVPLFDPSLDASPADGLARYESGDLSIVFTIPARLAGQMTVEEVGSRAQLRSWSEYPSAFNFWIRDLRDRQGSMPVEWSYFVAGIRGVPRGPSLTAPTEQPSAYGKGIYENSEVWFATLMVGDHLVALTTTAVAMSESEFVAFLISMESRGT